MKIAIRKAERGDHRAIGALHVRAWRWAYRGLMPDALLDALDEDKRAETWRSAIRTAGSTQNIWVAHDAEGIVGFASAGPSRDKDASPSWGELYAIYIEERVRGAGVGRALARKALVDLARRGFTRATLWVLDTNERGRRFYEAGGWEPDGKEKLDPRDGVILRELRYVIDLDPTV